MSLLVANPSVEPHYCAYNSGSPRCSYENKSPRRAYTFPPADQFGGTPSTVVEVTFIDQVILPADGQLSGYSSGPWRSLA